MAHAADIQANDEYKDRSSGGFLHHKINLHLLIISHNDTTNMMNNPRNVWNT